MAERPSNLIIEDAQLMFKNFKGEEKRYEGRIMNAAGARNFNVVVPEEIVQDLIDDGWNVKIQAPREEGDEVKHTIKVNVSYKFREPDIRMYTEGRNGTIETILHEDTVATLDDVRILKADIVIHPSEYPKDDGTTGLSGYCQELRVVAQVQESPFDEKYAGMMSPEE